MTMTNDEDLALRRKQAVYALRNAPDSVKIDKAYYVLHAVRGDQFCAVGYLAKVADLSLEDEVAIQVEKAYDLNDDEITDIIMANDKAHRIGGDGYAAAADYLEGIWGRQT